MVIYRVSQKNDEKREKNYCIQSVLEKVADQNTKFSKIPAQRGPAPLQLARARIYSSSLSVNFFPSAFH